jgi:hypothetical protein
MLMKMTRNVTLGVLGALTAVVATGCSAQDQENLDQAPHVYKKSIDMAKGVETDSNINQINMALGMAKSDNDGKPPATIEDAKRVARVPASMWIDGATGKPLVYDPATGKVSRAPDSGAPVGAPPAPGGAPAIPAIPGQQ